MAAKVAGVRASCPYRRPGLESFARGSGGSRGSTSFHRRKIGARSLVLALSSCVCNTGFWPLLRSGSSPGAGYLKPAVEGVGIRLGFVGGVAFDPAVQAHSRAYTREICQAVHRLDHHAMN